KTKVGGGLNLTFNATDKGVPAQGATAGQGGTAGKGTPGADFMSNEDIRAFSEHLRKEARNRAVERSMDAAQLEARLRNIPDASGRMAGSRARARRVTRYLKLIAAGEKAIAKWSTALYSAFEREFEAELIKIGKGRKADTAARTFNWR
ncbi:plasmid transfer protein TraA, partial [Streptomyces prasinopilosus]|uniref:plasmid transfer protein TraA n=1 Tax=Streptomyces prasinopilosus TaxID=67344 RepID=UPI0006EB7BFA